MGLRSSATGQARSPGTQRLADLRLEFGAIGVAKAGVLDQDLAVRAQQERGRHSLDRVGPGRLATGVEGDDELRRRLGEELAGVVGPGVDVDADHLESLRAVA